MITLTTAQVVERLLASAVRGGLSERLWEQQRDKCLAAAPHLHEPRQRPPVTTVTAPAAEMIPFWNAMVSPASASDSQRCYWPRDWPELTPERYRDRMVPVHFLDPQLGFGKSIAQFACMSSMPWEGVEGLWDILILPDEQPGAVVVAGGFLSGDNSERPTRYDHKLLWFRQQGLSKPGLWDAEVLAAAEPWSATRLQQLLTWQPPSSTRSQAA
jgi:hypothetical protein